ncbi:MAG: hypothetical protein ACRD07_00340 [Acidimicrobiales bacterium]
MEFVMVPVPEELASRVLEYVSWKEAQSSRPPADEGQDAPGEAIARAFARLDDVSRALVAVVATASLGAEQLSIPEAARRANVTTREALGILLEVNSVIASEGGPPLGFGGKEVGGSQAGQFTWDSHLITAPEALARPLADLTQAHAST